MAAFSWILYPHHGYLPVLGDEFVAKQFRFRLRGNSLQVDVEAPVKGNGGHEAYGLAERYTKTLASYLGIPLRLVTIEEFQSMPLPGMVTARGPTKEQHQRIQDAIRKARGAELKFVKKLANEPGRDERHAPKGKQSVQRPGTTQKGDALECATRVVRAYEQYLRQATR